MGAEVDHLQAMQRLLTNISDGSAAFSSYGARPR